MSPRGPRILGARRALGLLDASKPLLPLSLERASDEPIFGLDALVLTLSPRGLGNDTQGFILDWAVKVEVVDTATGRTSLLVPMEQISEAGTE